MAKRKIWAGPADSSNCHPLLVEGLVVDAFLPGTLVTQETTGLATSTKAATLFSSECLIAVEQGSHVGAEITTAYTIGDTGKAAQARSGEFFNVMVADGNNILKDGTPLSSNGDGTLKIATVPATVGATSEQILFYSREVVNVSGADALVLAVKA